MPNDQDQDQLCTFDRALEAWEQGDPSMTPWERQVAKHDEDRQVAVIREMFADNPDRIDAALETYKAHGWRLTKACIRALRGLCREGF